MCIYAHGARGVLGINGKNYSAKSIKGALKKKNSIKTVYLLRCKGAKRNSKNEKGSSVAAAFKNRAPNAAIWASKYSISFTRVSQRGRRVKYVPRISKKDSNWTIYNVANNPVKKVFK